MKRLLSINSYHYRRGGADAVYLDHAALFARHGWENRFFSMDHPRNVIGADPVRLTSMVDYEFATSPKEKVRAALKSIYNVEAARKMDALLREYRPDVAHVHGAYHHLTPAIFSRLSAKGVPIVLTAHDLKILCPAYTMYRQTTVCEDCKAGSKWNVVRNRCIKGSLAASLVVGFEAAVYGFLKSYERHVSMVVAPSEFYRDKFIEWGWRPDKITHVPNFVPQSSVQPDDNYNEPIVYFGRLSAEKGVATLVRASALAKVPVNIVGSGPMAAEIQQLVDQVGAPVKLLGRLEGEALRAIVGQSKAAVLPSEWYENGPMSVLESFDLARPVIGANIGGIPEMVQRSGAGWLFESGNVAALAEVLAQVASAEADQLRATGMAGRDYVRTVHTEQAYLARMTDVYRNLTGNA